MKDFTHPVLFATCLFSFGCIYLPSVDAEEAILSNAGAHFQQALLLADQGKAHQTVIISERASPSTKAAAADLAFYLGKISGATFSVATGGGARGIVLGTHAEFPEVNVGDDLEIRGLDGLEAFVIRTEKERLLLIGATEQGVSHAVFHLLEKLGCRWFFPAKEWEVIPSQATLSVSLNEAERPAILNRRVSFGGGSLNYKEYLQWQRRNRQVNSYPAAQGHNYHRIASDHDDLFKAHPEFYALRNGKRSTQSLTQLCLSNATLRKLINEWAVESLRKNPMEMMVSLEPNDNHNHCECDECAKLGSISDRVFGLANEVARTVSKAVPGKGVGILAYAVHSEPPSFDLEPNVYVNLAVGANNGRYRYHDLLKLWQRRSKNVGIYEYFSVWYWDLDLPPGGRVANTDYLRREFGGEWYKENNIVSLNGESGDNWGINGRGYYLLSKLAWNPRADVDAILQDFVDKAFGPAASAMKRYYERLDPGNDPLVNDHLIGQCFADIAEASQLAACLPDVQARLDHLKQYLRYVELRRRYDAEREPEAKKAILIQLIDHTYRTRHTGMNHWVMMSKRWFPKEAEKYNDPALDIDGHKEIPRPWLNQEPYSHDETEALFQAALASYPPLPIVERSFSRDLVRVNFEPSIEDNQPHSRSMNFRFYSGKEATFVMTSLQGESLVLEPTFGLIEVYRSKPPAEYTVRDQEGKLIAEGKIPLDNQLHKIEIPVPAAGHYWIVLKDSQSGCHFLGPVEQPVVLALERKRGVLGIPPYQKMYFYVPKGTREVQYTQELDAPVEVNGPDGSVMEEIEPKALGVVRIAVPEGFDGQLWSFPRASLKYLTFYNIPNYLAVSPQHLLIPREIALSDGLQVATDGQ